MKVFAIRHKPTGNWMPARMYRTTSAGWSYWEPTETREAWMPHDKNPRIFFTLQSARNALAMWLQGQWKKVRGETGWETPEPYDEMVPLAPDAPRVREDMEIVELELKGL